MSDQSRDVKQSRAATRDKRKTASPSGATDQQQSQRFIEAARELGADQSEETFNDTLRKLARAPARKDRSGEPPKK